MNQLVLRGVLDTNSFRKEMSEVNCSARMKLERVIFSTVRSIWKRKGRLTAFNLKCWTFKEHYAAAACRTRRGIRMLDEAFKDLISN